MTIAIALRQRGFEVAVYEQSTELREIGAAVALSANATRELDRLGVLAEILELATQPTELIYRNWRDGGRITAHPVRKDGAYRAKFGAPYLGIHRAHLQQILSKAHGPSGLHLGHKLTRISETGEDMRLEFANGATCEVELVIGADGVRSMVRQWLTGKPGYVYSGTSAFRGIVPAHKLPQLPDPQGLQFWMGPDAHLLHYAIGPEGGDVNFFAVVEGPASWPGGDKWQIASNLQEATEKFVGWHPAVIEMISAGWVDLRWGLFVVRQPRRWYRGRVVLIGDAVHGMLPHHGQGANTTIEDAITLVELLGHFGWDDLDRTLSQYDALRRQRTRIIQRSSWATNTKLHLADGPDLADRDKRVSQFPERFGWIHAHDARSVARTNLAATARG